MFNLQKKIINGIILLLIMMKKIIYVIVILSPLLNIAQNVKRIYAKNAMMNMEIIIKHYLVKICQIYMQ